MRIVVIGSSGALGKELLGLLSYGSIGLSHSDLDVTDRDAILPTVRALQPDWIINTAAFHRVDECEIDATKAFAVNAIGAGQVAEAAARIGAGIVYISTDHVFSGAHRPPAMPYLESDVPDPVNTYAIAKCAGECLVRQRNPRHLIVRTGGLYGWHLSRKGWSFPDMMIRKALAGEPLHVVGDQVLSPTFTLHLARTIVALIDANATGLFHLTNSGECSWYELARRTLELAGIKASIAPIETAASLGSARRPRYSALASTRLAGLGIRPLPCWHDAIADYVSGRAQAASKGE